MLDISYNFKIELEDEFLVSGLSFNLSAIQLMLDNQTEGNYKKGKLNIQVTLYQAFCQIQCIDILSGIAMSILFLVFDIAIYLN